MDAITKFEFDVLQDACAILVQASRALSAEGFDYRTEPQRILRHAVNYLLARYA